MVFINYYCWAKKCIKSIKKSFDFYNYPFDSSKEINLNLLIIFTFIRKIYTYLKYKLWKYKQRYIALTQ